MSFLDDIPISVWKTFSEIIPTSANFSNYTERYIDDLAKIIKSNSNFFVYNRSANQSFAQAQKIADIYKSLTTWFLGRTFRLLTFPTLSNKHHILVDIQLCILRQLSKTALQVFNEMAAEYGRALAAVVNADCAVHRLDVFAAKNHRELEGVIRFDSVVLEVERSASVDFLRKLLQIIGFCLEQLFRFEQFDQTCARMLSDLLLLLSAGEYDLKVEVSRIFIALMQINRTLPVCGRFSRYFEQLTYAVFNQSVVLTQEQADGFCDLLQKFILLSSDHRTGKFGSFLVAKSIEKQVRLNSILYTQTTDLCGLLKRALATFNPVILPSLQKTVSEELKLVEDCELFKSEHTHWIKIYSILIETFNQNYCMGANCQFSNLLTFVSELLMNLLETKLSSASKRLFFNPNSDFYLLVKLFNRHLSNSCGIANFEQIIDCLIIFSLLCESETIFLYLSDLLSYNFTNNLLSQTLSSENKYEMVNFSKNTDKVEKETVFKCLIKFIKISENPIRDVQSSFRQVCKANITETFQIMIITNLPYFLVLFSDPDVLLSDHLLPTLTSSNEALLGALLKILPIIICVSSSSYQKIDESDLSFTINCLKCSHRVEAKPTLDKINLNESNLNTLILKVVVQCLTLDESLKLQALQVLPACAAHFERFHSENVARAWTELCGDQSEQVRRLFTQIACKIFQAHKTNAEMVTILLGAIEKYTKKSLKEGDTQLQETVIGLLEKLIEIRHESSVLPIILNLIHFIMLPSSNYQLVAINCIYKLAEQEKLTKTQFYKQYKVEICKLIVSLAYINDLIANISLETSLNQISHALGYYNPRDFLTREYPNLAYYILSNLIHKNSDKQLIELSQAINVEITEILLASYGKVFISSFLYETKNDFRKFMAYMETTTNSTGTALRKSSIWMILNELLLNFHEKRDKVILALNLLAKEEKCEDGTIYLQNRFLGILKHFDLRLMTLNLKRKDLILLSLADLFIYMGPESVTPSRFKIIAMLRTHDYKSYPELHCRVWSAFIKSCEVETIGPQLATIFVSLIPLMTHCSIEINEIFQYLLVENESSLNESIRDLFFVASESLTPSVARVIRRYVKPNENDTIRNRIKNYIKYFNHETLEVRICSMKHLKLLLEKSRKQLDEIILGFNGIDSVIVELIDALTLISQREEDRGMRLACGEVFGELGAVEPSHLPRRYSDSGRFFTFYLDDDCFVVNALKELIKALQGEKNTVKMDRFGVAIQEILKSYEISPIDQSSKHYIWRQFSEKQQEIMSPFLNSRYIIAQFHQTELPTPIFGSPNGSSFSNWIYNWTCSLVSSLKNSPGVITKLVTACLPALKQDHHLLMQFLPHILLHSLVEGYENQEMACNEIKTITNSLNVRKTIDLESFNTRAYFLAEFDGEGIMPDEQIKQDQSIKIVFVLMDFLNRWLREWEWEKGKEGRSHYHYTCVKQFVDRFCKLDLAKCNYHCGEFPRALLYLEDYLNANPHETNRNLSFLAQIYAQLDESDGVEGITSIQQTEPTLPQRILALEVSNKLSDAASCYERMPQPLNLHNTRGLVQCYLDLDYLNTALNFAKGACNQQLEFGNFLLELQAEPLWRLGRFEELDVLLQKNEMAGNASWGVQIGDCLLKMQRFDRDGFRNGIERLKVQQIDYLGATTLEEGVYQQGYEFIAKLHALNELEQVGRLIEGVGTQNESFIRKTISELGNEWELRFKVVQESIRITEPLLTIRRVGLGVARNILTETNPATVLLLDKLLGECWLQSAAAARVSGIHQQSFNYLLKAEQFNTEKLFLEKAKLHWMREQYEQALRTLNRGIETILPPDASKDTILRLSLEKRKICAEAKLLIASYNETTSNVDTDTNKQHYKEAIEVYKEWEKSLVTLGQFYDRLFDNRTDTERDNPEGSSLQVHMINCFGKSLQYGSSFVYQSMPRLLSIWCDYGTRLLDVTQSAIKDERRNFLLKMTKLIDNFLESLPSYVFLTAFSQLVSRICHPQKEVYKELTSIIIKLLLKYPQQTLWMIISVIKSGYAVRAKRCADIFDDKRVKNASFIKLVRDFTNLAEKLIELCNKDIPVHVQASKVSVLLRELPRLLTRSDFSEIMIPTHVFRKLILPNPDFTNVQHNPFPNQYVHIAGIEEEIVILHSLQRPRKITFRGSDGRKYVQMLKPKDDLRKDFRLMEFNDIVNHLLALEPKSRQRRLNIRLYSVVPLNEECGLIEWIPNLVGLRPILMEIYKQRGLGMKAKELKESSCRVKDSLIKKRDAFTSIFIPRHPPLLGDWFHRTFPDAQSWFFARTAYTRTTAVISMVGYVLGLGDRHGENILFDATNGDTVHVDFNCLFNKGESFEWPERVPFRLTHNMIAAMGPLGVEGVFRKACACTLRVLRVNTNTLMSIVTPFVYDPLVSWHRSGLQNNAELMNEQAVEYCKNIRLRLVGQMRTKARTLSIPLSVDGQTSHLINEAASVDNLCQMYIGWGAYL